MIDQWAKRKKEQEGKKILVVYIPLTWKSLSSTTFESVVMDMLHPAVLEDLETRYNVVVVPMIHKPFPLDFNRNDAVTEAMQDHFADFIFFGDADQVFPKDTLPELLHHICDDFPIVTGIYFKKGPPHPCVVGKYLPTDENIEKCKPSLEAQGFLTKEGEQCLFYRGLQYFDIMQPVDVFGMGCVLVRADVFQKLELPYFKYVNRYLTDDHTFANITEDMWFCANLKKQGIRTLCNPKVMCGHIIEKVIVGNELVG